MKSITVGQLRQNPTAMLAVAVRVLLGHSPKQLASVIRAGLDAVIVTHDATMKAVAQLIGYSTLDPITAN